MTRIRLFPYKIGSMSGRLLASGLGALRLRREGRYLPRSGDFIINWGNGTAPPFLSQPEAVQRLKVVNPFEAVANAANKLRAFRILQDAGVAIPEFTTDPALATNWLGLGEQVYERHQLTGHSGIGIRVASPRFTTDFGFNRVQAAPLYTKMIANHGEYRIHVANGQVIGYTKKRRRVDDQPNNEQNAVRNLANGWVYTREHLNRLERVEQLALDAVRALGLDFGAVDIIKDEDGDVFVLEVNTACGMSETTLQAYLTAFREMIAQHA